MTRYRAGDRVYRYWYSYPSQADVQPLTVVRANRLTVTVRTDQGSTFRLPHSEVAGSWNEPTEEDTMTTFECGHALRVAGCGGCDPGAIESVVTAAGVLRPFDPARDLRALTTFECVDCGTTEEAPRLPAGWLDRDGAYCPSCWDEHEHDSVLRDLDFPRPSEARA